MDEATSRKQALASQDMFDIPNPNRRRQEVDSDDDDSDDDDKDDDDDEDDELDDNETDR
jgi:hypothetical protein